LSQPFAAQIPSRRPREVFFLAGLDDWGVVVQCPWVQPIIDASTDPARNEGEGCHPPSVISISTHASAPNSSRDHREGRGAADVGRGWGFFFGGAFSSGFRAIRKGREIL